MSVGTDKPQRASQPQVLEAKTIPTIYRLHEVVDNGVKLGGKTVYDSPCPMLRRSMGTLEWVGKPGDCLYDCLDRAYGLNGSRYFFTDMGLSMPEDGEWGTSCDLAQIAKLFGVSFCIHGRGVPDMVVGCMGRVVHLVNVNNTHWDLCNEITREVDCERPYDGFWYHVSCEASPLNAAVELDRIESLGSTSSSDCETDSECATTSSGDGSSGTMSVDTSCSCASACPGHVPSHGAWDIEQSIRLVDSEWTVYQDPEQSYVLRDIEWLEYTDPEQSKARRPEIAYGICNFIPKSGDLKVTFKKDENTDAPSDFSLMPSWMDPLQSRDKKRTPGMCVPWDDSIEDKHLGSIPKRNWKDQLMRCCILKGMWKTPRSKTKLARRDLLKERLPVDEDMISYVKTRVLFSKRDHINMHLVRNGIHQKMKKEQVPIEEYQKFVEGSITAGFAVTDKELLAAKWMTNDPRVNAMSDFLSGPGLSPHSVMGPKC